MINQDLIHHHNNPVENPSIIPVAFPERFEGHRHREAVLVGAKVTEKLVETQQLAGKDELTNLDNRRAFNEKLEAISSENNPHFALMYIDIDNFKGVNDDEADSRTLNGKVLKGHALGDEVLVTIAEILKVSCKVRTEEGEALGRDGGDEFVILMRTKSEKNSRRNKNQTENESIEGLQSRITELVKLLAEEIGMPSLGVSFGVVKFREDGFENETPQEFKQRADALMFTIKKAKKEAAKI